MELIVSMKFDLNGNEISCECEEVKEEVVIKRLRGLHNEEVQIKQS